MRRRPSNKTVRNRDNRQAIDYHPTSDEDEWEEDESIRPTPHLLARLVKEKIFPKLFGFT